MLHGACVGEEAGAQNIMFFRVKWLQPATKGTSCVRRLRLRSFHCRIGSCSLSCNSGFEPRVNSTAGGLMTSEDGRERIGSTARLPGFPPHGNTGMEPQQSVAYDQLESATIEFWCPYMRALFFSLFCGHMIVQLNAYPQIWCFDAVWKDRLGSSFLVDVTTSPLSRGFVCLCVWNPLAASCHAKESRNVKFSRGQWQSLWDHCQRRRRLSLVMRWETSWCVPARQTRQAVLVRLFQVINQAWKSFWTCLLHSDSFSFTFQAISQAIP